MTIIVKTADKRKKVIIHNNKMGTASAEAAANRANQAALEAGNARDQVTTTKNQIDSIHGDIVSKHTQVNAAAGSAATSASSAGANAAISEAAKDEAIAARDIAVQKAGEATSAEDVATQKADEAVLAAQKAESAAEKARESGQLLTYNHVARGKILIEASPSGWDQGIRELGNVIYDQELQKYIFVYSGYQNPYSESSAVYVGIATSIDGLTWQKGGVNGDGLAFDVQYGEDPYIVKNAGTYYIYFENKSIVPQPISLCTSTDLINWEYQGVVLDRSDAEFESKDVSSPVVFVKDNIWYMFYEGRIEGTNIGTVGIATSSDGILWVKYSNEPIITGTYGRSEILWSVDLVPDDILEINGVFYLTFHGRENETLIYKGGVAVSHDLFTWFDNSGSPISSKEDIHMGSGLMFFPDKRERMLVYVSNDRLSVRKSLFLTHFSTPNNEEDDIRDSFRSGFYVNSKLIYSGAYNNLSGQDAAGVLRNPPGGIFKRPSSGSSQGMIKITLPNFGARMVTVKGTVFSYTNDASFVFWVSFFTRQASPSTTRPTAIIMGRNSLPVRIYRSSSNDHIYIGYTDGQWSFFHVIIDEVHFSHGVIQPSLLNTPWSISVSTEFEGDLVAEIMDTFPNSNLSQQISEYSLGDNSPIQATDSILQALGKLQAQINALKSP